MPERTPHIWKEYHETMPPYAVCQVCGAFKGFSRERGTYHTIPKGVVSMTGEPQCRTDVERNQP